MAKVIRKTPDEEIKKTIPDSFKVVWGPLDAQRFRRVLDHGPGLAGQEQEIKDGTWVLKTYTDRTLRLIQYMWIRDRSAKLKDNVITSDDTKYVEQ